MVGFPEEEESNFKNTQVMVKEISPAKVHIFPYSIRKGTQAANLTSQIDPRAVKERLFRLERLSQDCAFIYQKKFLGTVMEVLIEGLHKEGRSYWQGHTDNYIKVLARSKKDLKGKFVPVKLKKIIRDCVLADFC